MEANLGNALILVAIGVLIGVAISFGVSIHVAPAEDQVNIQEEEMEVIGKYWSGGISITKIHDNKDNVTCWFGFSGISCIPDHMLTP